MLARADRTVPRGQADQKPIFFCGGPVDLSSSSPKPRNCFLPRPPSADLRRSAISTPACRAGAGVGWAVQGPWSVVGG